MRLWPLLLCLGFLCSYSPARAEGDPAAASESAPAAAPAAEAATPEPAITRIAVFLPEQIDGDWYWYDYGAGQQHLAQTAVEKALVNAGFEIIDVANIGGRISFEDLISPKTATAKGAELGADYVVAGKATATKSSESTAYGVNVVRANAEITLRLVRVRDGKVLAVEDASALTGGQAVRTAGQEAIKKAAAEAARKMVAALRRQGSAPQ